MYVIPSGSKWWTMFLQIDALFFVVLCVVVQTAALMDLFGILPLPLSLVTVLNK
jgi:hypothetical protein